MNKIVFKTLSIKNFLSVGNTALQITFQSGINLITGTNKDNNTRNGVGKSTIIESIYWCLFGNTIRDIKNDKIIHNHQKKGCEVELNFDISNSDNNTVSYCIIRTLGPSKIQIFKDGQDVTLSTIPNNDKEIQKIIGATPELFNNAIIMTADNTLPFMAQKKIDKRKFIEGILNLNIFTDMLLQARSDYNDAKKHNDILCNTFVNEQKHLETFEYHIQRNLEKKNMKISSLEEEIIEIKDYIVSLEEKKVSIDDFDIKIKETEDKIIKLETGIDKIEELISTEKGKHVEFKTKINSLKDEMSKLKDKKAYCPTCNRKFEDHDGDLLKNKVNEIQNDIILLEKEYLDVTNIINEKNEKKNQAKSLLISLRDKNKKFLLEKNAEQLKDQKIKEQFTKIDDLKKQIIELKEEKDDTSDEIEKIKQNIEKIKNDLDKAKQKLAILDEAKFVLSEEGVKTYIIKKLIVNFNQKLNFYLKTLDAPCFCEFDEFFDEKLLNLEGNECSYFNFSGGERKRIDVAILFTFQDILRMYSGNSYSLSMYDELFDSAIDEAGIEKIVEVLKKRIDEHKEMVYVISHNKSSLKNSFDNIIMLEKENGQTKYKIEN